MSPTAQSHRNRSQSVLIADAPEVRFQLWTPFRIVVKRRPIQHVNSAEDDSDNDVDEDEEKGASTTMQTKR